MKKICKKCHSSKKNSFKKNMDTIMIDSISLTVNRSSNASKDCSVKVNTTILMPVVLLRNI